MEQNLTAPTERIEKIVAELRKQTAQEAYTLKIEPERTPTIFDSKFGGLPYWDLSKPYPTDPDGEKLLLLAQINFDTAEVDAPLPQTGMLQFFIAKNDVYGLDFDEPDKQDTFRVIYHAQVDHSVTADAVRALEIPEGADEDDTPVCKEEVVSIAKQVNHMSWDSYEFKALFCGLMYEVCGEDIGEKEYDEVLTEEEQSYLCDMFVTTGHRMLGYPFFTQSDPRPYKDYVKYDTMLFQMDSEMDDDHADYVLWGDCGVGNFFIAREDLEKRDFSRVLYNWDCC